MAKNTKVEYHAPKIDLLENLRLKFGDAGKEFYEELRAAYPSIGDPASCPNCDASMLEYVYSFDSLDAVLLFVMARSVRKYQAEGTEFSQANIVHVPNLSEVSLAVRCRTTQSSKLGLIAKYKVKGKQVRGMWCITERGWAALRGEPVPRRVKVWRNQIEERFGETITLSAAFQLHHDLVTRAVEAGKRPNHDFRILVAEYNPHDWLEVSPHPGRLFV